MKLKLQRDQALPSLNLVTGVVERRQTLPILANVLLESSNDTLHLIGTDLEVEIAIEVAAENAVAGTTTASARKLLDICRALPNGATLQISQTENHLKIQSGHSRFNLQSLPAQDFPRLDEGGHWEERTKLTETQLRNLLEKTAFSMAQQDVRYFLNGVLLELNGSELAAVATDGHRLARSYTPLPTAVDNPQQAIIPRKAVHELIRFLRDTEELITLEINPTHLRFSRPGAALTTKIIDGKFPDYRSVMTQNLTQTIIAERSELYDVLARAAVLTNEKYRGIRLELNQDSAKVVAHNPDQEEARDEIVVEYGGEAIEIGFNVTYLMEALRALTENKVEIRVQDGNSGCLLQSPGDETTQYLIMPMRL
jgi:DNA polymerase-3 subunit beta